MIIICLRCGKEIDTPDETNADYIMADDTIERHFEGSVPIVGDNIQKTGIICPDCHKPTDTMIWGIHARPSEIEDGRPNVSAVPSLPLHKPQRRIRVQKK